MQLRLMQLIQKQVASGGATAVPLYSTQVCYNIFSLIIIPVYRIEILRLLFSVSHQRWDWMYLFVLFMLE